MESVSPLNKNIFQFYKKAMKLLFLNFRSHSIFYFLHINNFTKTIKHSNQKKIGHKAAMKNDSTKVSSSKVAV